MRQAVQLGERKQVSFGERSGHGLVAGLGAGTRFADEDAARCAGAVPRSAPGRRSKIARAFLSAIGAGKRLDLSADHQLSKGCARRMHLVDGARVLCRAGKVWITFDGGGEDIVLAARESRSFCPGAHLLIEALAPSRISLEAL